jgi:hypothetical protein
MMGRMWRQDDEALLERLEDEILLEKLWRFQAGDAQPPHPRAAGMIALVRKLTGGPEAVAEAQAGRYEAFFAKLLPPRIAVLPPALLHHIALYYGGLADALASSPSSPDAPDPALEARKRSLAAWLALGEEKSYLTSLARAIAGGALPDAEIERAADEASMEPIDDLGRAAQEGAHEQTRASWLAIASLMRVPDACRAAGLPPALTAAAVRRADRWKSAAADQALAPILEAFSEATARGDAPAKAPALLERTAQIWRWSHGEELVEIFAVEQATPVAWEIQRESRWDDLRRLLTPVMPLVEHLAARVEADPTKVAYAGPCAQFYVFLYELENDLELSLTYAERSVKLCPTHRNGRLVLASGLCDAASHALTQIGWYVPPEALDRAEALVTRAEKLYPSLQKIESVKQRIADARRAAGSARV